MPASGSAILALSQPTFIEHKNTHEMPDDIFTKPMATFELFIKLPIELRLRVWRYAFPRERLVLLKHSEKSFKHTLETNIPVPSMLHVNTEARTEALKVYKPMFGNSRSHPVYFNCQRDLLILSSMNIGGREMANHLRYLFSHVDQMPEVTTLALDDHIYIWIAAQCKRRLEDGYKFKAVLRAGTKSLRTIVLMPDERRNMGFNREMKISRGPMKDASDPSDNMKYLKELLGVDLMEGFIE